MSRPCALLLFLFFFTTALLGSASAQVVWTRVSASTGMNGWFSTTSFDGRRMSVSEPNPVCYTNTNSCFFTVKVYQLPAGASQWVQMGQAISNVTTISNWGYSATISGDGTRLVVGSSLSLDGKGAASFYEWDGSTSLWVKKGQDLSGMVGDKGVAKSVSISYDGTLVSCSVELSGETGYGGVRVYRWLGDTLGWQRVGQSVQQVPFNPKFKTKGGVSKLSRDGRHVAVLNIMRDDGQPGNGEEVVAGMDMAIVCSVFFWDEESKAWFQMGKSFQVSRNREHQKDRKIAISDNGLVVAAHSFESNSGTLVSVFEFVQGVWSKRGNSITKSSQSQAFAFDLSGDGNKVVCTDFTNIPNQAYCNLVYQWDPAASTWGVVGKTPCPVSTKSLYATLSLSISGDGSAVTESFSTDNGNDVILNTYTSGDPAGSPGRPIYTTPPPPPSTTPTAEPSVSLKYTLRMSGANLADFDEDNVIRLRMGIARTAGVKMKQVDTKLFESTAPLASRRLLQSTGGGGVVANVTINATTQQSQSVQSNMDITNINSNLTDAGLPNVSVTTGTLAQVVSTLTTTPAPATTTTTPRPSTNATNATTTTPAPSSSSASVVGGSVGGVLVLVVLTVVLLWYGGCFKKKPQTSSPKSRLESPGLFQGVQVQNPFSSRSQNSRSPSVQYSALRDSGGGPGYLSSHSR